MREDTLEDSFFGAILSIFLGWIILFESEDFNIWKNIIIITIIAIAVLLIKKGFQKWYIHFFTIFGSYFGIISVRGGPIFDPTRSEPFFNLLFKTAIPQHQYDVFWILIILWIVVGEVGKKI